jgi:hypothetical protein
MEAAQGPTEVGLIFCFTHGVGRAIGIVVNHTLFVFTNIHYPGGRTALSEQGTTLSAG